MLLKPRFNKLCTWRESDQLSLLSVSLRLVSTNFHPQSKPIRFFKAFATMVKAITVHELGGPEVNLVINGTIPKILLRNTLQRFSVNGLWSYRVILSGFFCFRSMKENLVKVYMLSIHRIWFFKGFGCDIKAMISLGTINCLPYLLPHV